MTATIDQRDDVDTVAANAERISLGAAMQSDAARTAVTAIMGPDDWALPRHRHIAEAITAIGGRGEPVNPPAVLAELDQRGQIRPSGGAVYLTTLVEVANPAWEHYAHVAADHARLRRLDAAGQHLQQLASLGRSGSAVVDDVVSRARAAVDAVVGDRVKPSGGAAEEIRESWSPADLTAVLNGTARAIEPDRGARIHGGPHLLYAAREHLIISEMEAGKTWLGLACSAVELDTRHVVYVHFEDADPGDTVTRLLSMGVRPDSIRDRFHFLGPEAPLQAGGLTWAADLDIGLVVLDGVNEAMALHGFAIYDADGVADFRRRVVKPWKRHGAAVLLLDHVVKDKERRGRHAFGSVHKTNAVDGAAFLLESKQAFGRGARGASRLYVVKDRPGYLRSHGDADRREPGRTYLGSLIVDDTRTHVPWTDVTVLPKCVEPETDEDTQDPQGRVDAAVLNAVATLQGGEQDTTTNAVREAAGVRAADVGPALARLVAEGALTVTRGPRNSKIYALPTGSHDQQRE